MNRPAFALAALLLSCVRQAAPPQASPPPVKVNEVAQALAASGLQLDPNNPATCAACHEAVVKEWNESLHARAHHAKDPLYARMRALRTERQGEHIPGKCAQCHNPRDPVNHESPAAQSGVSCAVCHQLEGVHPASADRNGLAALQVGPDKTFRATRDVPNGTSPLHATGAPLPALVDGQTLCLACHGEERNAAGVATCSTGVEIAAGGSTQSCTSCHMPEVQGPSGAVVTRSSHRSHGFLGPRQAPGILDGAVSLTGRFEGERLVARLENRSAHAFPTGFPARMALLVVTAFDAQGQQVFQNVTTEPMKEHPEAVFNKGYVDAEGKPSLAPFAVKLVRDNRLKPDEVRELAVVVPKTAVKAELRLRYFAVAPPAAKLMAYEGPETKPVTLAPVVVSR